VPPLRDRVEDIAPLALFFLEQICRDLGRETLRITQHQIAVLKKQAWPGNIRELKNVIERAVISSTGSRLRLDVAIPDSSAEVSLPANTAPTDHTDFMTSEEFRAMEKANITAALRHADWKVWGPEGAAVLLGMKPSTLAYQMKALGIDKKS